MGSINLSPKILCDSISETVGYKSGIALSIEEMSLPVTNNQPDYKLMETFISAIQKQVIKDVVLYSDKKLNIAK